MNVDIFIRTYSGDIPWLNYCLKSIYKFGSGYRNVIVCIPEGQEHYVAHLTSEIVVTCPIYTDDYVGQQITKLNSFKYTDADYMLFTDSDCIFTEDFNVQDYFKDGKPIIVKESYESIKEHKDAYARKSTIEMYMREPVEFEYMRRQPFLYRRDTLIELSKFYTPEEDDRKLSEFNLIGAYCDSYEHDKYCILEVGKDEIPHGKVKQFWSWGGLLKDIQQEIEYTLSDAIDIKHRKDIGVLLDNMEYKICAEIGVQDGENARNILKSGIKKLYLVDLWETQDKKDYIDGSRDIDFNIAYEHVSELKKEFGDRVEILKMHSDKAAKIFSPGFFDFIYLDANHHNPQFEKDLNNWFPLLKTGGLFGGHDYYDCNFDWYKCEVKTIINKFAVKYRLNLKVTKCSGDESWWCIKP